jgi:hypothetical protein
LLEAKVFFGVTVCRWSRLKARYLIGHLKRGHRKRILLVSHSIAFLTTTHGSL